jgi:alginate O-acetyltransferase complex protein AlgJ
MGNITIDSDTKKDPVVPLLGKDNFLFLSGDSNRVIEQLEGRYDINDTELSNILERNIIRSEFLKRRRANYYHIIAPNKETIFNKFLPDQIEPYKYGKSPIQKYIEKASNSAYKLFYKPDTFQDIDNNPYYYRTDTHWANLGALTYLNRFIKEEIDDNFSFDYWNDKTKVVENSRKGDLGAKINFGNELIKETTIDLIDNIKIEKLYENNVRNNGAARVFQSNKYLYDKKILFLHDSFGTWCFDFLPLLFSKVVTIHTPHFDVNFLSSFKFDLVIFMQAERFLVKCPSNHKNYAEILGKNEETQLSKNTFYDFILQII